MGYVVGKGLLLGRVNDVAEQPDVRSQYNHGPKSPLLLTPRGSAALQCCLLRLRTPPNYEILDVTTTL